ncbi:hypothetical protein B296_00000153 [Ensete ventricosum]|uniref:Uncharacterized protein n=1 Tax=Ensete ventricosum TaxID=4639 RepID=A0A427B710_ENSVE|nr:hypothetical protein B296_00000153 [Ensete ventricosum]
MAILYTGLFGDGRGDPERPLRCPMRSRERERPFLPAARVNALYLWEGSLPVHPALPLSSLGIWSRRTEDVRMQRHGARAWHAMPH